MFGIIKKKLYLKDGYVNDGSSKKEKPKQIHRNTQTKEVTVFFMRIHFNQVLKIICGKNSCAACCIFICSEDFECTIILE